MRITLVALPGRGDTEPFLALGRRLQGRGHEVKLAGRPDFADLVAESGIAFAPIGNPYQPFITGAAEANAVGSGHFVNQLRYGIQQRGYVTEGLHEDARAAIEGSEAVVYKHPYLTAHTIAENLAIPCVPVMLLPFISTRAFPSFIVGAGKDRGPLLNELYWKVPLAGIWQGLRIDDLRLRRRLGMRPRLVRGRPPLRQCEKSLVLAAWSPLVIPRPADWPSWVHVTGYWISELPPGWQPPPGLEAFLAQGPAPISIGFGSMASGDRIATLRLVLRALELSGLRAVLLSGWGEIGRDADLPDHVFSAPSVPHGWLFPRVAAVVHHGGAGTTGAALRSGTPAVIVPFLADQPSWGRTVHALGAGPAPIPFRELTAERLAGALVCATTDQTMRVRASELGERIRAEDGTGPACDLIEDYVGRS